MALDPALLQWTHDANSIRECGRWDAVNKTIRRLCARPGANSDQLVTVFAPLCAAVFSEYLALRRAFEDASSEASLVAWRARNLLELSVWSLYCSKDTDNARRLYADAGRDVLNIFGAFSKWSAATGATLANRGATDAAIAELSGRATAEGIESLEGAYKSVGEAAKEVGLADHFALGNKLLSKFAHPTAMQIFSSPNDAKTGTQKELFFCQGCLFFVGAFNELERRLSQPET
jgi:hypothetical protein